MQTFLPYEDFERSASVLDYRRLGKQRIEAKQILLRNMGVGAGNGWTNHPAVKMWQGFNPLLCYYGLVITNEWRSRGYEDNQRLFFLTVLRELGYPVGTSLLNMPRPPWLGREDFHRSHRANLLRKAPDHYSQYWDEDPTLPYVWPKPEER